MQVTAAEQLIWTGQRLDPESPLYNMALAFHLRGPLDLDALDEAFRRLVAREPALRMAFEDRDGEPARIELDPAEMQLERLTWPTEAVSDEEVDARLRARTRRVMRLEGPLTDACVVQRAPDRHVLYVNQHHIVTDAWSTGVLYGRWAETYREVVAGLEPTPAGPRFADYVAYEARTRTSSRCATAIAHWNETAGGFSADLPLYGHRGRGSGRTSRIRVSLGAERARALQALAAAPPFRALTAQQSRYHVFATVLLAWLHRISGEDAVSVGSPWHNRSSEQHRATLGLFIELFPLRVRVSDDETFASLASKVARAAMTTLRDAVPGASATPGARGYAVVLNYITARTGDFADLAGEADWIHSGHGDAQHRLRLQVHDFDEGGEPTLDFDLDVEVFDEEARAWAVDHFLELFDALVTDPNLPLQSVPLSAEVGEPGVFGPATSPAEPVLATLLDVAARQPAALAVVDDEHDLDYGSLIRRAGALAAGLRERGLGPGDVVGVFMERSSDLVVALVGVLQSGAAYLPLDPEHPDDRIAFCLEDAGAARILTTPDLAGRAGSLGPRVETLDDCRADTPDVWGEPTSTGLAYVLYTSGSTGRPKGVEVTHEGLADYLAWAVRTYAPDGAIRMPLFTSVAFDMSVTSIFTPLLSGGCVRIYRAEGLEAGLLVRNVFEDAEVDVVKMTPSHLALVRDLNLAGSPIRRMVLGGEDLRASTAEAVHSAFGGRVEIFNEYGPTEATVACTIHRFDPSHETGVSVPIGQPTDNVGIHLLGVNGQPVPRGVIGEIYVSGPRVARGYRHRPALTAEAFVALPGAEGERMYRTGDLGRWTREGWLEFHGRVDEQVKVKGVRLELGEVEGALLRHPRVKGAVAQLVEAIPSSHSHCIECGIEAAHPEARIDDDGVCAICRRFAQERAQVAAYFGVPSDLEERLRAARAAAKGPYDTLMLYSGGKDSTYALCQIVEMGANPLVFLLDNGFISDQAKTNVRRVVDQLGLDLVVAETPAMNDVFADSLERFSNVCQGCFKAIYTLALNIAVERGIPALVTGLSRGQIFESRLADLYRRGIYDPDTVDRMILEARKAYHRMDDAVSRAMDVEIFETDDVLDSIDFIDFYRYVDVELDELLEYVNRHTPWIRPSDTGRSTNCLINQAGIWVHTRERGFHNYTLPYSWDVRLGHKERDAALAELDDQLVEGEVREMLEVVGYHESPPPVPQPRLVAFYAADEDVPVDELRRTVGASLPREAIPSSFMRLEQIPLTDNGKVDRSALPQMTEDRPLLETRFVAPRTPVEETFVSIWREVLGLEVIGVDDDFFELGGDSMHSIQIVAAARERGLTISPRALFAHPTVAGLASVSSDEALGPVPTASVSDDELASLEAEFGNT